ncbi:MAG TPA: ABC transporter ATP-binding protein [Casimicrobiaceae bacterium]
MRDRSALLEVEALRVGVGGRTLIDAVSLTVRPGDVWCVLGANGAGKTLLLHTLAGLRPPDGGAIALAARPIAHWRLEDAARVRGFLPQFSTLTFPMTVADAVVMGRHPHLSRWAWEGNDEATHANRSLADVGLEALARRDVTTLSGGERQRVAIATLLAQDTPLMLLDEPIAHLDLRYQLRVLDHLAELGRRDRGIVLSIHDLTLARRCATHALLLHGDGRVDVGRVEDVMTDDALSGAFSCRVERVDASGLTVYVAR